MLNVARFLVLASLLGVVQRGECFTVTIYNTGSATAYGCGFYANNGSFSYSSFPSPSYQTIAPGGSITCANITGDTSSWNTRGFAYFYTNSSCSDARKYSSDVTMTYSGNTVMYVQSGAGAPANYCASLSVVNIQTTTRMYAVKQNGVTLQTVPIPSGGKLNLSACSTNPITLQAVLLNSDGGADYTYNGTSATNNPASSSPPSTTVQGFDGLNYYGSSGSGSSSNVVFLGSTWTTNLFAPGSTDMSGQMSTIYKGLASLGASLGGKIDAVQNGVGGLSAQLGDVQTSLQSSIAGLDTHTTVNLSNVLTLVVTNSNNLTLSNFNFTTNLFSVTNNGLNDSTLTNQLSALTGLLSNKLTTANGLLSDIVSNTASAGRGDSPTGGVDSGSSDMLGRMPFAGTNAGAATTLATSALGDALDGWGSATGLVSNAESASGGLAAPGSASGLTFVFGNGTISLDPESIFPGFMGVVRGAWTFLALVLFCRWGASFAWDIGKAYSAAQVGGVANLTATVAGFGGNVAGVVCAIAVPVAFIALWVGVLKFATGFIMSKLGLLPDAASGLGLGGNQIALYLLNACFPVSLIVSLSMARVSVPMAAGRLTVVAASASRFLFGR